MPSQLEMVDNEYRGDMNRKRTIAAEVRLICIHSLCMDSSPDVISPPQLKEELSTFQLRNCETPELFPAILILNEGLHLQNCNTVVY